jgi:glycosyltransferase involved in cell wall biosynthesis
VRDATKQRRVLIIVENLPVPFDRRVWQEATTLQQHGYQVSIICPKGKGYEQSYEFLQGVHIYRHTLPPEGEGAVGYAREYSAALFWEWWLAMRVWRERGFDVIHGCNPPDTIFLIAWFFRLFGKRYIFDHHDINPELFEAKFGHRRGLLYRGICLLEKLTFRTATVSIATNESYKRIAIERGGMSPGRVFVVRSGPNLERVQLVPPQCQLKRGRRILVGYVGVMGKQEGIDLLLESVRHIVHDLKRTDIHFGLVGGGTSLESMRQLAQDLGVADYVTFTGRAPDAEMFAMLSTADLCVNPDLPNEMNDKSTMNKIMEYMALGKPIVQFDLTEGRFSAGEASLYARNHDTEDFARKILQLADAPEVRERMGMIGRERIDQHFEWRHEVPKLLAAYELAFSKH